jgi:hypothetical protein
MICIKRIYSQPSAQDGTRVLVDASGLEALAKNGQRPMNGEKSWRRALLSVNGSATILPSGRAFERATDRSRPNPARSGRSENWPHIPAMKPWYSRTVPPINNTTRQWFSKNP